MNDFTVIKNDDALTILTAAWNITKKHYEIILGTTFILLAVTFAMSWVPYIRHLASIPLVLLSVGQMYIFRQLIDGNPTKFTDVFRPFENQEWMTALLPLAVAGVGIALVQFAIGKYLEDGIFAGFIGALMSWTLTLIWIALTAFSAPLIAFKAKPFKESIDLNLKATTANWLPLLILFFYILGVLVFSALLFVLPLFFIALPVMFVAGYLTYTCMFEGLNIDALAARFKT